MSKLIERETFSNVKVGEKVQTVFSPFPLEVIENDGGLLKCKGDDVAPEFQNRLYHWPQGKVIFVERKHLGQPKQLSDLRAHEDVTPYTWSHAHGNVHVVLDYLRYGVNVLPVRVDGSKRPKGIEWGSLFHTWISPGKVETYFQDRHSPTAIGLVCGPISGNLEVQDIDRASVYEPWCERIEERAPGLWQKLTLKINTGGGGWHVPYRCSVIEASDKLAREKVGEKELNGKIVDDVKVLVETRGIGSMVVGAGSPPRTHSTGKPYRIVQGSWDDIPVITPEERDIIMEVGRSFNLYTDKAGGREEDPNKEYDPTDTDLPGIDFNVRGDWGFLEEAGYEFDHEDGESQHWTRPGKSSGTSVTTGYQGLPILHSFSSSIAEFDQGGNYTRFAAYAKLAHDGDFSEAARALIDKGYGKIGRERHERAALNEQLKLIYKKKTEDEAEAKSQDFEPVAEQEVVEQAQPEVVAESQPEVVVESVYSERTDPLFSYLWEGVHNGLTDTQRKKRMGSVRQALTLVPEQGLFKDYIQYKLPCSDCPVVYHVASAIAMCGHVMNRTVTVEFGDNVIIPNIWAGILGPSSVMHKSYAINSAKRLLTQLDDYEDTVIADGYTYEALAKGLGFKLPPPDREKPEIISSRIEMRKKCQEDERFAAENDMPFLRGVGMFHLDEIGGWLAELAKTSNSGLKETITKWYDNPRDWWKDTATQGMYYVYRPCISILGASTPEWLFLNSKATDLPGGFMPRWLFFNAQEKDYVLSLPDAADPRQELGMVRSLRALSRLNGHIPFNSRSPAFPIYNDWRVNAEETANAHGQEVVVSWITRMGMYCLKVAAIYQATTGDISEISVESMRKAIGLINHVIGDLSELLEGASWDMEGQLRTAVLRKIVKGGVAGTEHAYLLQNIRGLNAKILKSIIDTLEEQEVIVTIEGEKGRNGKARRTYHPA